jgi:ABC-type nitrate/sulfonate/bicarbonate transport system substrate-binding protein
MIFTFAACGDKGGSEAAGGSSPASGSSAAPSEEPVAEVDKTDEVHAGDSAEPLDWDKVFAEIDTTEPIKITLPTFHSSGGPCIIAEEFGWFDDLNLEIEEVGNIPGGNQIQSVITGDIDFTLGNHADRIIQCIAQGFPVKIVLAQSESTKDMPHMRWMVPEDSDIDGPEDLVGKKIAMTYITGGCPVTNLREYLRQGGVTLDQVQMVQMDDNLDPAALEEGIVDVISGHAPTSGAVREQYGLRTLFTDFDTYGKLGGNNMATSVEILENEPEKVKRFVAVIVRAQQWIDDHQAEADEIYARVLELDPALIESFDHLYYAYDGIEYDQRVQLWIDDLVILGEIKEGQIQPEEVYTNEFNPYTWYEG